MSSDADKIDRLRAREAQARDIINALLAGTQDRQIPAMLASDAADWLNGNCFEQCSICRRRHRSDDRHPCE